MDIKIRMVAEGLYLADLALPDVPTGRAQCPTIGPMNADQLIDELLKRGAHQTDIGDAFYAADPNWLSK